MQLSCPCLQLIDAPLDFGEVSLCMRFENSNRLKQIDDLDLLPKLVKASLEHAVGSGFFAEASATCRHETFDVEYE